MNEKPSLLLADAAWHEGHAACEEQMQRVVPPFFAQRGCSEYWKLGYDGKQYEYPLNAGRE